MQTLSIGQRSAISQSDITDSAPITLRFTRQSPIGMDISCFALDAAHKLVSESYMIFYNQPTSPCGQLKLTYYESAVTKQKSTQAEFEISLSSLPASIDSLFFVLSADTPLKQIQSLEVGIWQQQEKARAVY